MDDEKQAAFERVRAIHQWAAQTISFAMSQRALDQEVELNPKRQRLATQEVEEIVNRCWNEALQEASTKVNPDWIEAGFVRRIFAWCYDHLE